MPRVSGPPPRVDVKELDAEIRRQIRLAPQRRIIIVAEVAEPGVVLYPRKVGRQRGREHGAVETVVDGGRVVEIAVENPHKRAWPGPTLARLELDRHANRSQLERDRGAASAT